MQSINSGEKFDKIDAETLSIKEFAKTKYFLLFAKILRILISGFASLRTLLPHHEGEKLSKAAILQQTAE